MRRRFGLMFATMAVSLFAGCIFGEGAAPETRDAGGFNDPNVADMATNPDTGGQGERDAATNGVADCAFSVEGGVQDT